MKQIIQIFKKDLRRFRWEVATSVVLVSGFAWEEVRSWSTPEQFGNRIAGLERGLPTILLFLSWWLIVTRVIQDESLVGDRQFWITRPYDWRKLLAAKILFVAAFVNLPLLIADVYLLVRDGYDPTSYLFGLFWMQLMIVGFLLLPIAAFASITPSLAQMGLASLILMGYLAGVAAVNAYIPNSSFSFDSDDLQPVLLVGVSAAAVILQYARRRTSQSRFLLAAAGGIIAVWVVVTPYGTLVTSHYPGLRTGERAPVSLELLLPVLPNPDGGETFSPSDDVEVNFPVKVSGVAVDSIVKVDGTMLAVQPRNGPGRNHGWESSVQLLYPDTRGVVLNFTLPRSYFERIKNRPATVRISLIMTEFHQSNAKDFLVPFGRFQIPGVGRCSANAEILAQLKCQSPLKEPSSLLVTTELLASACPASKRDARAAPGEMAHSWQLNSDSGPATFGFSPIQSFEPYFSPDNFNASFRGICPGTLLALSDLTVGKRFRTSLEMDNTRLDDHRFRIDVSSLVIR
jgi:hypothetical protein